MLQSLKDRFIVHLNLGIENMFADAYIAYLSDKNALDVRSSLDVGAGWGVFVKRLRQLGIDAEGIESVPGKVDAAVAPTIKCGIFGVDYKTKRRYDLVTLTQVIYFTGPAPEVLKHLRSFLNPNGLLFIVTSTRAEQRHLAQYPSHQFYDREQYRGMAKELGYEILDFSFFQTNLGAAFNDDFYRGLLRMAAFKLGLRRPNVKDEGGNHAYILMKYIGRRSSAAAPDIAESI